MSVPALYVIPYPVIDYMTDGPSVSVGPGDAAQVDSANSHPPASLTSTTPRNYYSPNLLPLDLTSGGVAVIDASGMTQPENAIVRLRAQPRPLGNPSQLIAEWEGHVTAIDQETFEARLRGISGDGVEGESEEATIPLSEIAGPNKELFAIGALFRLCVSYEESDSGEIRRYTNMVFRRLPAYRKQDLEAARERARERLSELRVD